MPSNSPPTAFSVGMLAPWKEEASNGPGSQTLINELTDDVNKLVIQESEKHAGAHYDILAVRPAYILYLPRELLDKVLGNLSQRDHKSLRATCGKLEEILNPIVFQRIHLSKARKDRMAFWNLTASPKLTGHVKELVWYELAEDENVFRETANDPVGRYRHDGLRNAIQQDNIQTLPDLENIASGLFWLPSVPDRDDPNRHTIEAVRTQSLNEWRPRFYDALDSMPKLDTFTSRPMPAHHVLSGPQSRYEFVAYHFQMDVRSDIQGYQRNDGLFSALLPAMIYLRKTIKHLHWADETHGKHSSIMRLRYRHKLAFKYLHSLDLCLCLPFQPVVPIPRDSPYWADRVTCWRVLGECIHRTKELSDISMCFEMANPRIEIHALADAVDQALFSNKVRLPGLTSLTLRDGPRRRFFFLDALLGEFLAHYGPQLRHLRFDRWSVNMNMLFQLWRSEKMQLEGFKVDNVEFEKGATVRESDLVDFVNRVGQHAWQVPLGQGMVRSTVGSHDESKEDACVCDWANPKFQDIPQGMDYCAVLEGRAAPAGGDADDEDDDYQPSESTETSESDSDFDQDSDFDMGDGAEQN